MKTTLIIIFIFIGLTLTFLLLQDKTPTQEVNNINFVQDQQIITITAKGGYSPSITTAKANTATTIEFQTKSTFDCSSAVVIPAINYRANLPFSGTTKVEIPAQKPGTTLQGLCSMGMYNFQIKFE